MAAPIYPVRQFIRLFTRSATMRWSRRMMVHAIHESSFGVFHADTHHATFGFFTITKL